MNIDEMNEYIKHYLEKDKTQSAIMLSAPWGVGKSYYIKNVLVPFLKDSSEMRCIIVSLYGLKDISEVSKSIFLESKFRKINKKSAKLSAGKLLGKTIAKGVASFFGVDLNVDEKDLNKLYESINLSNKLIILEDVERSHISILEILGFVNNLVEQDGAKVLLVTNEDEILHYVPKLKDDKSLELKDDKTNECEMVLDKESQEYIKVKEKTIGDTIKFYSPSRDAICSIVKEFNNEILNEIVCDDVIDEIENIMDRTKSANLRSFIFSCQKTIDIIEKAKCELDKEFIKNLFLGNVAFCIKKKNNENLKWPTEEEEDSSTDLGTYKFPVFRFSYDYICNQYLDVDVVKTSNKNFCNYREKLNEKKELKPYLDVIYSYYIKSEKEVLDSINYICGKLIGTSEIPFEEYGRLSNYLISIKYDIKCDDLVDKCKKAMLENLKEIDYSTIDKIRVYSGIQLESEEANKEFVSFKNELESVINKNNKNEFDFDYTKEKIKDFCDFVYQNRDSFIGKRCFASKINNDKFVNLLEICSSAEIHELRGIFQSVYRFSNIKDFFLDDLNSIIDLKKKVEAMMENNVNYDNIQRKQVGYLIDNLEELINRLS